MRRVAFAGLGSMGFSMARNVLRAGFPLTAYDVRAEPREALAALGATCATTPREAAAEADVLILMVLNAAQAEEVLFGADGAIESLRQGATVILMSTVAPSAAKRIASRLADHGVRFLDCPVSGASHGAEAGTLTLIAGGPAEVLDDCREVLLAMGKTIYHIGEAPGSGEAAKVVNNLLAGVSLAATAEALTLAAKMGLDPRVAHEVILHGSGDCWMARSRGPRMIAGDFTTTGRLDIFVKDIGAALAEGEEVGAWLPLARSALALFERGTEAGWGGEDDSAIVKVYEREAGIRLADV